VHLYRELFKIPREWELEPVLDKIRTGGVKIEPYSDNISWPVLFSHS